MLTVLDYIDLAIEKNELGSDRQLARALNISNTSVTFWRTGRTFPSDAVMVRLAALAGITPEQGLLELAYWKAEDESAQKAYKSLLSKVSGVISTFIICFIVLKSNASYADTGLEALHQNFAKNLHYQTTI